VVAQHESEIELRLRRTDRPGWRLVSGYEKRHGEPRDGRRARGDQESRLPSEMRGDLVEVYNDNGSTQAMASPTPTAKRKQTVMLFTFPTGPQGNVVSKGVNELIIPNYKQTWGNIRKIASAPEVTRKLTFKSQEYRTS
jgi:hypothetical protein